ncbi:hypothetical protein HPB50_007594 [Hyalomma asiaticum]|uniref:Uncharacterized protein n=1 Tax=Hyalomma asiaticum TaxID=266040 RepID=A0ACB7TE49_HYAAI|nr:hypothetical protein HPB50_007594 [Hyalomma asiaticum]
MLRGPCSTRNLLNKVPQHGHHFRGSFAVRFCGWGGWSQSSPQFRGIVVVGAYHVLNYSILGQLRGNGDTKVYEYVINAYHGRRQDVIETDVIFSGGGCISCFD